MAVKDSPDLSKVCNTCQHWIPIGNYGQCMIPVKNKNMVMVTGPNNVKQGHMYTNLYFGCNQWEQKE